MELTQAIAVRSDQVAAKVMDGEAILIDMSTGNYFSMADTAGFIWSLMEQGARLCDVVSALTQRYGIAADVAETDVLALAEGLLAEGLVDLVDAEDGSAAAPDAAETGLTYVTPRFEKFSDMAEMFALDPPLPGLAAKRE